MAFVHNTSWQKQSWKTVSSFYPTFKKITQTLFFMFLFFFSNYLHRVTYVRLIIPEKKLLVDFLHDLHCFFLKKMMLVVFNLSKYNNGHRHRLFSFYYSESVTSFLIVCMGGTRILKFLNCQQMNVFFAWFSLLAEKVNFSWNKE